MDGLFTNTAWHYARYRPGYPREVLDQIITTFRLDRSGRVLDLGCGTGQLTVPLAMRAREVVGVDPEPEMLIEEIQNRFVPTNESQRPKLSDNYLSHEEVLRHSAFPKVDRRVYEFRRRWTIEQAIGYLYSTSLPLRRLLDDRESFEQEISRTLSSFASDDQLFEPVSLEVFVATRR